MLTGINIAISLRPPASGRARLPDAIVYTVTRPRRMAVNEMLVRPSEQSG
jgi:NADP-dependent 3-hydroxy acid dehydrogenase YdfG